ncbi:putative sulfate/molybdate transporter [Hymenobacter qilianensis]|uniref:putative sulfate/molybdate transporter n=1 Tax=Hymenobacter qilianensis TaxID=1385715 RepID=UPI001CB8FAC0|nr:putative sulfate/molybdate transporter [Hymenobacter qilianensis]
MAWGLFVGCRRVWRHGGAAWQPSLAGGPAGHCAGGIYALVFKLDLTSSYAALGFHLPTWHTPNRADVLTGALLLALPQIPLSLGNSILATKQVLTDFFPERRITVRQISFTYSLMNLVNPFFGGVPVCHGSGGW